VPAREDIEDVPVLGAGEGAAVVFGLVQAEDPQAV
jgi:hypothetical protein